MSNVTNSENRLGPAFTLDQVDVSFSNPINAVLRGINLSVARGEIFVIIGPGGEGKTVLLKTLVGLYSPSAGRASFCGSDLNGLAKAKRRELTRRIGMTFQRSGLFDSLTAEENLSFPLCEVLGLSPKQSAPKILAALAAVGLAEQEKKFPHEMSGGMQKRLGIARALVLEPEAILYDDPTAGLDPVTSRSILDLILTSQEQRGTTVLLATSDLDLALSVGRRKQARIGFLYQGKFLEVGTSTELRSSSNAVIQQFIQGLSEGPLGYHD